MSTANVIIPAANAGIADLVYGTREDHIVVAGSTANAQTVSNKTLYGLIYGFVNGEAMITAPEEFGSLAWATSGSAPSWYNENGTTPKMRNGGSNSIVQMNTERNKSNIKGGSSSPVILNSAIQATSLEESTFGTNASPEIKRRYNTYWEYIRQTFRVNGVPGTCFGKTFDGCKVHELGRYVTQRIGSDSAYPAIKKCYDYARYTGDAGNWWLPSMFELAELMCDEHLSKINAINDNAFVGIYAGNGRWSCVRYSSTSAWFYRAIGSSGSYSMSNSNSTVMVRPVTLLKL